MKIKRKVSFVMALILSTSLCMTNVFAAEPSNAESVIPTEDIGETREDFTNEEIIVPMDETDEAPEDSTSEESVDLTEETVETPEDVIYDTVNGKTVGISPEFELKPEMSSRVQNSGGGEKIDNVLTLGNFAKFDANNKVIVELPEAGDTKTFNMQIDHSLYPEARLCVYINDGLGDCKVNVSDIGSYVIRTNPASISPGFNNKYIININGSGGVKDYTVTVSTSAGNACCALILATQETLAEMCGGRENATSIQKNISTDYGVSWFGCFQPLLTGEGEWFRYTADGDTYIRAYASMINDLTVSVYEADTGTFVGRTTEKDREIERESDTSWTGQVSKKLAPQPGHEYLFQVQSSSVNTTNNNKMYGFTVGLASTIFQMIEVTSTNSYTIPANTTKIYTFKVSGYPNSTRLSSYGRISFQTGSVTSNLDITSCTIKAPNGKIFNAPSQGLYTLSQPIDYNNYFTSPNNVPLNGTWTVTIRSSAALSGLKFRIKAQVEHIPGSDGNE